MTKLTTKCAVGALTMAACLIVGWGPATAADTPPMDPTPAAVSARLTAARGFIQAKNWSQALSTLQAAQREEPANADIQNLLGYSYRKQEKPDLAKAFEHYKKALTLDPKHVGAHEYIGEAYLMNRQPAEAQKHLLEIEKICGNRTCEAYQDLSKSIANYQAK